MFATRLAVLFGLVASAAAQTFVVDAANGPGTDYTSISDAVAGVPDGAVLQVRPGNYAQFFVVGKSLKVLGQPGVQVFNASLGTTCAVVNLGAGQSVVLQDITFVQGLPTAGVRLQLSNNQGSVLLDGVTIGSGVLGLVDVLACQQLLVRDLDFNYGSLHWRLTNSHAVFQSSRLGIGTATPGGSGSGLVMNGGSVQLTDCIVGGAFGLGAVAYGVEMQGGDLRLLGTTRVSAGPSTLPSACVGGSGVARYDAGVTFGTSPAFAPTVAMSQQAMPTMRAGLAGGVVTASLDGPTGGIGVVAVALVGPRLVIPGIDDALWLDGGSTFLLSFGVFAPGAPVTAQLPWLGGLVPAVRAVWQGASLDANGALQLSNPALTILP